MEDLIKALKIMEKAWGNEEGYAFFPVIKTGAKTKLERAKSYDEGDPFYWPRDRLEILDHLDENRNNDVYWCPVLFNYPRRRRDFATNEHCLWADLDEADPRGLQDYTPSVAWETSPGRYQALWIFMANSGIIGASEPGAENHRLSYFLGADNSGWDTTQLLRIPGWHNHKLEYQKKYGMKGAPGKLLWAWPDDRARLYRPSDFRDLPEVPSVSEYEEIFEDEVDAVDRDAVWTNIKLKVSRRVREMVSARSATVGARSAALWEIERELADAGCSVAEIISIVRDTPWNKYREGGRQDEFRRLVSEASKAVAARDPAAEKQLLEERDELTPAEDFFTLLKNIKPPKWLIEDIWTENGCGFIAGEPKSFKSWFALDMALSVSTGSPFLNRFNVAKPGPVLYLQEEDALPTLKKRRDVMWEGKQSSEVIMEDDGLYMTPPSEMEKPKISAKVLAGITLSDELHQQWLAEELERGYDGEPYVMIVLDPLANMMGDIEENKANVMNTQLLIPLRKISIHHEVAVAVVHHMAKVQQGRQLRPGQRMRGSGTLHAWAHDALYLSESKRGVVEVERESKTETYMKFDVHGITNANTWEPQVGKIGGQWDDPEPKQSPKPTMPSAKPKVLKALRAQSQPVSAAGLARSLNLKYQNVYQHLIKLRDEGLATQKGTKWIKAQ